MKLISLFSGAGGMDAGFIKAGFDVLWANEYDKTIWATHERNFPNSDLNRSSITDIQPAQVPECDGIIGGPPCQSFSSAGAKRGTQDARGRLFLDYIRLLVAKKPKFFVAENVPGLLAPRHKDDLLAFINAFEQAGYETHYQVYDAQDYNVPQSRRRLIFTGIRKDLGLAPFVAPVRHKERVSLRTALAGLGEPVSCSQGRTTGEKNNHEYMASGGYSSMFMSRNRVRDWDKPSFTVLATARQAPLHPQAPAMEQVGKDKFTFVKGQEHLYRRLSVRECARVQTFPDNFQFVYDKIENGYKMVGNAVPVNLAYAIACQIKKTFD